MGMSSLVGNTETNSPYQCPVDHQTPINREPVGYWPTLPPPQKTRYRCECPSGHVWEAWALNRTR
jgi:hypothetical protein